MLFSKAAVCAPLILVMALDFFLTIAGQPDTYWQDHSLCNESSPVGKMFLSLGPGYFSVSFALYLSFAVGMTIALQGLLKTTLAMSLFLGHAWGGCSWVPKLCSNLVPLEQSQWYLAIAYFFLIAATSSIFFTAPKKTPSP